MNKIIYILIILIIIWLGSNSIIYNDYKYFSYFINQHKIKNLLNQNKLNHPIVKKNKILFLSYDNRINLEYVLMHNRNLTKYTEKFQYEYKFYTKCDKNVYWCKIHMMLDELENYVYDYVIWLDSDTIIKQMDIDIGDVLNEYNSDIYIGSDNNPIYDLTNAGVIIVKNTIIGKTFLKDCIESLNPKCIKKNGSLNGKWAGSCYEQGIINLLLADKYNQYATILPNEVIFNSNKCVDDVFIMHLYASSSINRKKCFETK